MLCVCDLIVNVLYMHLLHGLLVECMVIYPVSEDHNYSSNTVTQLYISADFILIAWDW